MTTSLADKIIALWFQTFSSNSVSNRHWLRCLILYSTITHLELCFRNRRMISVVCYHITLDMRRFCIHRFLSEYLRGETRGGDIYELYLTIISEEGIWVIVSKEQEGSIEEQCSLQGYPCWVRKGPAVFQKVSHWSLWTCLSSLRIVVKTWLEW